MSPSTLNLDVSNIPNHSIIINVKYVLHVLERVNGLSEEMKDSRNCNATIILLAKISKILQCSPVSIFAYFLTICTLNPLLRETDQCIHCATHTLPSLNGATSIS